MKYLLDTHTLIWLLEESPLLSARAKEILIARENSIYVSAVSLWEIAIKVNLDKLKLRFTFGELLNKVKNSTIEVLQIEDEYLKKLSTLPFIHKDPFDRLLISTALVENLTIITADADIQRYDVPRIW